MRRNSIEFSFVKQIKVLQKCTQWSETPSCFYAPSRARCRRGTVKARKRIIAHFDSPNRARRRRGTCRATEGATVACQFAEKNRVLPSAPEVWWWGQGGEEEVALRSTAVSTNSIILTGGLIQCNRSCQVQATDFFNRNKMLSFTPKQVYRYIPVYLYPRSSIPNYVFTGVTTIPNHATIWLPLNES